MFTWTKDKPTEPGWYWHKPILGQNFTPPLPATIRKIQKWKGVLCDAYLEPILHGGFWAGPIPEPTTKEDGAEALNVVGIKTENLERTGCTTEG